MMVNGKEVNYVRHDKYQIKGFFGDYRFLSNYHIAPFWFEGRLYTTREHAFQAAKYPESQRYIFDGITSAEAKKFGGKAQLNIKEWEAKKVNVMLRVICEQFAAYPELEAKLVATDDRYLEESNSWRDSFWGVYYPDDWTLTNNKEEGKNQLGHLLMAARDMFKYKSNYNFAN